jgi:hypothetical protein
MITARIEFRPGCGEQFCFTPTQDVVELKFDDINELIQVVKDFEPYIFNCIAHVDGKTVDLRQISGVDL